MKRGVDWRKFPVKCRRGRESRDDRQDGGELRGDSIKLLGHRPESVDEGAEERNENSFAVR